MRDFLTAATAMSESPLIRFLGVIAAVVIVAKMLATIASVICEDLVNQVRLTADLELAQSDADWADEATPMFDQMADERPSIYDTLAAVEAAKADWNEPAGWSP